MKTSIYLEAGENQIPSTQLLDAAKKQWTEAGNKAADLKSVNVYVRLSEGKAYFQYNDDTTLEYVID